MIEWKEATRSVMEVSLPDRMPFAEGFAKKILQTLQKMPLELGNSPVFGD